jgi:hypothetical protein
MVTINDMRTHEDRQNGDFLVGEWNGRPVRVVIGMLPSALKAAVESETDITGAVVTAMLGGHQGRLYAYMMRPQTVHTAVITISLADNKKRGAPAIRVSHKCGPVEVELIEAVVMDKEGMFNKPSRQSWPISSLQDCREMFGKWQRSKALAAEQVEGLLAAFKADAGDLDIEDFGDGLARISGAGEELHVCYLVDLEDPAYRKWLAEECMHKLLKMME